MRGIYFLEGIWGSGKTTFGRTLEKRGNFLFVHEPIFPLRKTTALHRRAITQWYWKKHMNIFRKIMSGYFDNGNVVAERSPVSWLAFMETYHPHIDIQSEHAIFRDALNEFMEIRGAKANYILLKPWSYEYSLRTLKAGPGIDERTTLEVLQNLRQQTERLLKWLHAGRLITLLSKEQIEKIVFKRPWK